jgi:hypothetical protein
MELFTLFAGAVYLIMAEKKDIEKKNREIEGKAATWIVAVSGLIAALAALVSAIATLIVAMK